MKAIGISAKHSSPEALAYAAQVADDLRKRGLTICFDERTAGALGDLHPCFSKTNIGQHVDLLVTFGGDGTLLAIARHAPANVPILGVNMGTLGFLTEIRVEEFPLVLEHVLAGEFRQEGRVTFDVTVDGPRHDDRVYRVLNDAAINKSALARIIEIKLNVAGLFVTTFRADGLVVSTPTGSTAYNLSAGGPIIYPTMEAVVITPICPHMLTNRPIVLPDALDIEISIETRSQNQEIYLTLDGQEGFPISDDDRVCVRKSHHHVMMIQSPDKSYFDVLRTKLKWGEA
ncbi:MAG TPA: NAD(+)/NADH kinase [Thermoanaerobaculia bacterium]|nr:NAD(+)/NADH kinase [Thermoanaerobaculia bacterium]